MGELIGKAWRSWLEFEGGNKLTALFLLAILALTFLELGKGAQRRLFQYGAVMGALCICPVTAAVFMLYQTKFYDYQWIWTLVPFTAVIACGGVLLWDRLRRDGTCGGWRGAVLLAGGLALILLCGGSAVSKWDVQDLREEREEASRILDMVSDGREEGICLWAPEGILEYARSLDSGMTLLYGRNMWLEHLNAYSYDTYTQEQRDLYVWMTLAEKTGRLDVEVEGSLRVVGEAPPEGTVLKGKEAVRSALSLGANRILLPGCMEEDAIAELEEFLQCGAERAGEYYLFRLDPEASR